jgi:hypothetical protein
MPDQIGSNQGVAIIGHYIKTHMHARTGAPVQGMKQIDAGQTIIYNLCSKNTQQGVP